MSEYEDMMLKLRLPHSYELTGGPEGTGKIKVPKGMLDEQALAYDAAIQRRKNPDRQDAYDTLAAKLKKNAQAYERKKLGKPRPTYFPQEKVEEEFEYFEDKGAPTVAELVNKKREEDFVEFTEPGSRTLKELYDEEMYDEEMALEEEANMPFDERIAAVSKRLGIPEEEVLLYLTPTSWRPSDDRPAYVDSREHIGAPMFDFDDFNIEAGEITNPGWLNPNNAPVATGYIDRSYPKYEAEEFEPKELTPKTKKLR